MNPNKKSLQQANQGSQPSKTTAINQWLETETTYCTINDAEISLKRSSASKKISNVNRTVKLALYAKITKKLWSYTGCHKYVPF